MFEVVSGKVGTGFGLAEPVRLGSETILWMTENTERWAIHLKEKYECVKG
jgi:hypothetical protein